MINVNGQRIDANDRNTQNPYAKRIQEGIKLIEDRFKFPVILKYPDRFKMKIIDANNNPIKKPEWPGGKMIRFTETVEGTTTSEEWQYYSRTRSVEGKPIFEPFNMIFDGYLKIYKKDADLAFFLLFISPFCENSITESIRTSNTIKHFIVEDKQQEAYIQINVDKSKLKVEYLIKTADEEDSEMSEEALRKRALSYGISETDTKSIWEIQTELLTRLDYIFKGGQRKVYDEFLEGESKPENVELMAIINRALQEGKIGIKPVGKGLKWSFRDIDGKWLKEITKINPNSKTEPQRVKDLCDWFADNETEKKSFVVSVT